jgi:transcription factor TFB4
MYATNTGAPKSLFRVAIVGCRSINHLSVLRAALFMESQNPKAHDGFFLCVALQVGAHLNDKYIQSICSFLRNFLLSRSRNNVSVVLFDENRAHVAYPRDVVSLTEARSSGFSFQDPQSILAAEIADMLRSAPAPTGATPSSFDSIRAVAVGSSPQLSQALTKCVCIANKCMVASRSQGTALRVPVHSRILVLGPGGDFSGQYIQIMNASFAARRMHMKIDCISTGSISAPMLEQLADVTDGFYIQIGLDTVESQLPVTLALLCAADADTRSFMAVPKPGSVGYKSSCVCHSKSIDIGFVCSRCLSVHCQIPQHCVQCAVRLVLPSVP